jgi:hypothetical protein
MTRSSTPRVLFAALALAAAMAAPASAADRVVLISWDGVRRDTLHELLEYQPIAEQPKECPHTSREATMPVACGEYWSCLPNLCRFQVVDSKDVEGKALTRPQHAQMLTGYGPQETGDITNSGRAGVPEGMTVYERLAVERPDVATVHLAGLKFIGEGVISHAMDSGAIDLLLKRGARDRYTGIATTDQVEVGLDFLGGAPAFFFFIHYKAADVVGHRAGDRGRAYRQAIIGNDAQLGAVLALLDGWGQLEGTEVYVTTDHGFDGIFHINRDTPSIAETWLASRTHDLTGGEGSILDVTPTILDAFGVAADAVGPPYRGVSRLVH